MMKHQLELKQAYIVPGVLGVICIALFGINALSQYSRKAPQATIVPIQPPSISVETQADSPLRVLQINTDSLTTYMPEVELTLTNVSMYPISAYSVRFDVLGEKWQKGGVDLSDATSDQAIFKPGQSKQITLGGGVRYSDPIKALKITIDFVEFTNGTIWGPDSFQSGERLAGRRAGAQAIAQRFREIFHEKGPSAVLAGVETESVDVTSESNHSARWLEGFQSGITVMRSRIKEAYSQAGLSGIETALTQAFDAREEKERGSKDVRQ
jgi:hypothetical protein